MDDYHQRPVGSAGEKRGGSEEHDKLRTYVFQATMYSCSPTVREAVDASESYHSECIWHLSCVTWACYKLLVKHLKRSIEKDTDQEKLQKERKGKDGGG